MLLVSLLTVSFYSFLIKKETKKSRKTRSLRAFFRANASPLPEVHRFGLVDCWANKSAGVVLMDTEQLGRLPSASGGKQSNLR